MEARKLSRGDFTRQYKAAAVASNTARQSRLDDEAVDRDRENSRGIFVMDHSVFLLFLGLSWDSKLVARDSDTDVGTGPGFHASRRSSGTSSWKRSVSSLLSWS